MPDETSFGRYKVIERIGDLGTQEAIRALVAFFPDEGLRWMAVRQVSQLKAAAIPALLEALHSPSADTVRFAAYSLGEIRALEAVPALVPLLANPDPEIRQHVAYALGMIRDKSATDALIGALKDTDPVVRGYAATALGEIQAVTSCTLAARLLALPGDDLQDSLRVAFLNMGEPLSRAIYLLGKLKATSAVDAIIPRLHDPDPGVRRFAAIALAEIGDPRAEEFLVALLRDKDPALRTYAAVGLMSIGGRISIRLLLASLNDPETRWLAVRILDKIGSRDVDSLISALSDERTGWYAEEALTRLDGNVLPQLEERLKGPDPVIRESIARVMGEVKDRRAVAPLLEAIQSAGDTGGNSATALIRIADPAAVEPLIELLGNQGEEVRLYAAYALGGLMDRRAVPALTQTLADASSSVRGIAAHSLGQIGSRDATTALIKALADTSAHVRATAAYALARIGDRSALPMLEAQLRKDPDFTSRRAAQEALDALRRSGR